jgi:4-hydroxybenzoate polyprenyltransferase
MSKRVERANKITNLRDIEKRIKNNKSVKELEKRIKDNKNIKKIEDKLLKSEDPIPKTKYPFVDVVLAYAQLMRPFEWSKTLMNMVFGLLIAFYVYSAFISIPVFILGFASVALLWAGLYALNDFTDWKMDLMHPDKKFRPIPSGKIKPNNALFFAFDLIVASFLIGIILGNIAFIGVLLVMMLNQLLYTTKPFKLKSRKMLDIISGSMVNPICRYFAGLLLFISVFEIFSEGIAILPVVLMIGVQVGSYLWYRFSSKELEKKLDISSSVAKISEKWAKRTSRYVIIIAILSYFGLFINYLIFKDAALGFLPPQYMLAIAVIIFGAPLAWFVRKNPRASTNKYFYAAFHLVAIVFSIIHLLIFVFLR